MMYLMGGSMRPGAEGKVALGLWGPWTITDFSGWSDQMTLDYNFVRYDTHSDRTCTLAAARAVALSHQ